MQDQVLAAVEAVRQKSPLVHNITNFVVMQVTANALLAAGASPLMAHEPEELDDLLSIASALVLNIGTLDKAWIASMRQAGELAGRRRVPVVLDPVGAGASRLRTETALTLLNETRPAVVRGNASEIMALSPHLTGDEATTKGVDSTRASHEAETAARDLAARLHCVVSVSGEEDLITDGDSAWLVRGGSPLMTLVTGMGCSATAVTADELIDLQESIPDALQANCIWVMSRATRKAIRKLKDADGNYLLNKDLTAKWGYSLLGRDVYVSQSMPDMAASKRAVLYLDPTGLAVKVSETPSVQVLREKFADEHAVGVICWMEVDSKVENKQKVAVLAMGAGA